MQVAAPILCYGRAPVTPSSRERVRTVRTGGRTTVAVFPPGPRRCDFVSVLAGALLVAGMLAAATLWFSRHPVPLARYAASLWPLAAMLAFFLVLLAFAWDEACRQVEFDVDADQITRTSVGPFGIRRRTWDRRAVLDVRVECHISGSHPRVVFDTDDGRRHVVLSPGAAHKLRDDMEDAARHLRVALR